MKQMLMFLMLAGALVLLASVAVALMISISAGRTSGVLVGVFVLDSLALLMLAARATLGKHKGPR